MGYARVADGCGLKGVQVHSMEETTEALRTAMRKQMENSVTIVIALVLNQEMGEPFRRDAMNTSVVVAGISQNDMRPQLPVL